MISNRLLGGILLVSGTTIGAGMLGLPIVTGTAGFAPALFLLACYWVYMLFTALLMLEVTLWMDEDTNLTSMAKNTLGAWGEAVNWITYLFLLYCLTTAYLAGSGTLAAESLSYLIGTTLPNWCGVVPLLLIFSFFVYRGARSVDHANRFFMLGLACTYLIMVIVLTPATNSTLLAHTEWKNLTLGISLVATSFGFHIIIPTLRRYLDSDIAKLKKTIVIGSIIPLILYITWEFLALGIIPIEGEKGLIAGYSRGEDAAKLLAHTLGNSNIGIVMRLFSFFAIVTSFLGVTISLRDFLADGFHVRKTKGGRFVLDIVTFAPPLLFVLLDPRAFISALQYAGAFGVMVLLGLMPALMVWWGRYKHNFESTYKAPGGKLALIATIIVSICVIVFELGSKLGIYG